MNRFPKGGPMKIIRSFLFLSSCVAVVVAMLALPSLRPPRVLADSYSSHRVQAYGYILDNPALTIAGVSATTSPTSTTGATTAHIAWVFGTVAGSYSGCS